MSLKKIMRQTAALLLAALCVPAALATQALDQTASGETVLVMTRRLCELGYLSEASDLYDETVRMAVSDFQTANGLENTGLADVETQQTLYSENALSRDEYLTEFARRYEGVELTLGSTGEEVVRLQEKLEQMGYYSAGTDGSFGEATRRALLDYQKANGIEQTGIGDKATLIRLYEGESVQYFDYLESMCAKQGDSGSAVKNIQRRLTDLGYYSGEINGNYGEKTLSAVQTFQNVVSIATTGEVDVQTYMALFAEDAASVEPGSILPNDSGDDVTALQNRLSEMGFLQEHQGSGTYDWETQTAVLLFCMANQEMPSAVITPELQTKILYQQTQSAHSISESGEKLLPEQLEMVSSDAEAMTGRTFTENSSDFFAGYSFARYIFATRGVDIGSVSDILTQVGNEEKTLEDMVPGDIVILTQKKQNDELVLSFCICLPGGTLAYMNTENDMVEAALPGSLRYQFAYVWDLTER